MNVSINAWLKLISALVLLASASIFHANASSRSNQQAVNIDLNIQLLIPSDWEQQKNLMGNQLVASKKSMNGGSGSDALLMVSDVGLNQSKVPTLGTAMKKKISQICFHAESCRWGEIETRNTEIGPSLLQKITVVEMGREVLYWVLIVKARENQLWSATLRAPIGMSKAQEIEFKTVLVNVFVKNDDLKNAPKTR